MQDYRLLLPALIVWTVAIMGPLDYIALGLVGLLALLGGLLTDRWYATLIGAALVAAAVSGMAHSTLKESDVLTRSAKNSRAVTVTGVIDSHPRLQGDSHVANAFIDTVTTEDVTATSSQSVRMTWSDTELTRGSAFTGTGTLQPLPDDFAAVAMLDLTDVVALSEQSGVDTIRRALRDAVEERPWHAQLIPGVVVGDDTGLPEHAVEDMRILGLSHLTAVSGAHISLTIGLVLGIVGRKRPILAGVLSIVALAGLVELVGSEASVLRAGYMGIFVCFALAIRRATTAFPILCATVIIVALLDVELARSLGFQLSAVATGAIIAWSYPLQKRLSDHLPGALADVVSISLIAAVATGPLLLSIQEQASLWSAVANALVAPVVAPLTILGMAGALLLPVAAWAAVPFLWVCELCTAWMAGVASVLIDLPGSHLPTHVALIGHVALALALTVSAYVGLTQHALAVIAMIAGSAVLSQAMPSHHLADDWEAIQCDVGQGSALLARREEHAVLIDVGPAGGHISTCIDDAGIEHLDLFVISHFDADHVRGLDELIDAIDIGEVWYSPNLHPSYNSEWAIDLLDRHSIAHTPVTVGKEYTTRSGEPLVRIVGPRTVTGVETTTNDDSLAVVLTTDTHRILALADAPFERQLALRGEVDDIDVVIVGHHGAADQSEELAQHLQPVITLISVGDNDYGHPTQQALQIWEAPISARTDTCGTIAITAGDVISGCRQNME